MTVVNIDFRNSQRVGLDGTLRFRVGRRIHIDAPGDGVDDFLILPQGFEVTISGGVGSTDIFPDDGVTYCWVVDEEMGPGSRTRFVHIPQSSSALDYGDLQDIDPATLEPDAEPEAAWWIVSDTQIDDASLRDDYHLILIRRNGETKDLGYVRGEQGNVGPAGPVGMTFRGAWSSTIDYNNLDAAVDGGTTWFAVGNPPVGEQPSLSSSYWAPMAIMGSQGNPGPANSLSIGTITKLGPGSMPTAAISGTSPAQILALGLVTGDVGAQGPIGDQGSSVDLGSISGAISLASRSVADIARCSLTGNISISALPALPAGKVGTFSLRVISNGFIITGWPAGLLSSYGTKPTLSAGATPDLLHFTFDGVAWWVSIGGIAGA